jgi:NAD(P)-dependent dehydrogenase (short-subunit alcohol dehydrogenase family)
MAKTLLITGATNGIGLAAAKPLAALGESIGSGPLQRELQSDCRSAGEGNGREGGDKRKSYRRPSGGRAQATRVLMNYFLTGFAAAITRRTAQPPAACACPGD